MSAEHSSATRSHSWLSATTPVLLLILPILLLSTAVRVEMNSIGLYTRGFHVYEVSETTGISEGQLTQVAGRLIGYFNSITDTPQMTVTHSNGTRFDLYHDYELIHLADVKVLFFVNAVAQAVSLLLVVVFILAGLSLGRRSAVLNGLRYGAILTLALLVASGLAFAVDFNRMFVVFHLVAFDNPFWQLNPFTDYLVMLFPLGFWQDMFIFAGAGTGLAAGIIYVAVTLSNLRSKRSGDASKAGQNRG